VISVEETLEGLAGALSLRARIRCLVQVFGSGTVAGLTGFLWWTEDDLPVRTQIGFAAVVAIGLGWVFVAGRALLKRGRLFAADKVIAGWIALGFAVLLAAGVAVMGEPLVGAIPVAAAIAVLVRAGLVRRRLQRMIEKEDSDG
jgi:hypothetical protein